MCGSSGEKLTHLGAMRKSVDDGRRDLAGARRVTR